jgi:hypothetical protein
MAAKAGSGAGRAAAVLVGALNAAMAAIAVRRVSLLEAGSRGHGHSMFGVRAGHVFAHVVGSLM